MCRISGIPGYEFNFRYLKVSGGSESFNYKCTPTSNVQHHHHLWVLKMESCSNVNCPPIFFFFFKSGSQQFISDVQWKLITRQISSPVADTSSAQTLLTTIPSQCGWASPQYCTFTSLVPLATDRLMTLSMKKQSHWDERPGQTPSTFSCFKALPPPPC